MEKKKILVVIDVQNDFVSGSLGTKEAEAIVPRVQELIDSDEFDVTLFTMDTHDETYMDTLEGKNLPVPHCIRDTEGWKLAVNAKVLKYVKGWPPFHYKDTFGDDTLPSSIQFVVCGGLDTTHRTMREFGSDEIESITIVGLCTDICVIANTVILKTAFPETKIICDASACAGVTPEKHKAALEVMRSLQIEVINDD